jgi:hypothetical protein
MTTELASKTQGGLFMRRIQLLLGALAIVVTALAAFPGPAMADDLSCTDAWGNLVWCEGDFYAPVDEWWDDSWWWGNDWDGNGIVQDGEQESESGEINQSFDVS